MISINVNSTGIALRKQMICGQGSQSVALPEIEHLQINYRTHSGITNVAASVVDLIRHHFPLVCADSAM